MACMKNAILRLKKKKIFLCPLCFRFKSTGDPLYTDDIEKLAFLSIENVLQHLNYTHQIQVPLTSSFFTWLHTYRLRGKDGLIEQYWKETIMCRDIETPIEHYWDESKRELYNVLCDNLISSQLIYNTDRKFVNKIECNKFWASKTELFLEEGYDYVHLEIESSDEDENVRIVI